MGSDMRHIAPALTEAPTVQDRLFFYWTIRLDPCDASKRSCVRLRFDIVHRCHHSRQLSPQIWSGSQVMHGKSRKACSSGYLPCGGLSKTATVMTLMLAVEMYLGANRYISSE